MHATVCYFGAVIVMAALERILPSRYGRVGKGFTDAPNDQQDSNNANRPKCDNEVTFGAIICHGIT